MTCHISEVQNTLGSDGSGMLSALVSPRDVPFYISPNKNVGVPIVSESLEGLESFLAWKIIYGKSTQYENRTWFHQ